MYQTFDMRSYDGTHLEVWTTNDEHDTILWYVYLTYSRKLTYHTIRQKQKNWLGHCVEE